MIKKQLETILNDIYGKSEEQIRYFQAPGRVNLIGEHIDYNGGHVFPAAINKHSTCAARKTSDNVLRIYATDLAYVVEAHLNDLDSYKGLKWGNYQIGVLQQLIKQGYNIGGAEIIFDDKVPLGSGLSSSAAIELVTAYALSRLYGYDIDPIELALISQKAEHEYVGVQCGIMDQFASAMGKRGSAILLNTDSLEYRHVPLNMLDYTIVISNTNKKRSLTDSKYNERRSECEEALADMQKAYPNKLNLCDFDEKEYLEAIKYVENPIAAKRAQHAVHENLRVLDGVELLEQGDLKAFGALLNASHISLRDLYEVSCEELDVLAENAWNMPYVLGSRMTGAGFGGCTVSIVETSHVQEFIDKSASLYKQAIGYEASFYVVDAEDGVKEI